MLLEPSFLAFLQKSPMNMMLFAVAVVTGGMLLWPVFSRLFVGSVPQVGATQAVQLINRRDALVIDVRDKKEFAAAHIPNARNIPVAELEGRLREIEKFKSRPIVINGQPGSSLAAVCGALKKNGFAEVFALRGGIRGWLEASLPIEKQK